MERVITETVKPKPGLRAGGSPPVLGKLLSGTFWLVLKTPVQAVLSLWTVPLMLEAVHAKGYGAYGWAFSFGFFQLLFEFGMGSALQRQVSETWTKGDRDAARRAIACGMNFYAVMACVQATALLSVAYFWLPRVDLGGEVYQRLAFKLLWLQALTAPCFGLSMVVSSILQAARKYDFIPRFEIVVVVIRFLILYIGVKSGFDFFAVVATQTIMQIVLTMVPALWVAIRELGHWPHFRGTKLSDYKALLYVSSYMFLMQLSVVLADKVDMQVIGGVMKDAGSAIAVYQVVSKPFLQIRQTGWTLAYLVLPAVASLAAARDKHGMDRVKYDGTRLHIGVLLPTALLAWVFAPTFLTLWVGNDLGYDAAQVAPLFRLFLVATLPLIICVPVQAALGVNKIAAVAIAAMVGSLVNLPLSIILTMWLGVSGVIWGTVLTTLFSNLLIPGIHVFRALDIRPRIFFERTLAPPLAGALALLATTFVLAWFIPLHPSPEKGMSILRWVPLACQMATAGLAYAIGYLAVPVGRGDWHELSGKFLKRAG